MSELDTVTVYGFRGSPFVEKVIAALVFKNIPWRIEMMKTPAQVNKRNPVTKKMPALMIEGKSFYDSTFILRELEQRFPKPSLWAEQEAVAAQQRMLEDWCDESLYWYIMAMRWQGDNAPKAIAQITSAMPAVLGFILGKVLMKKLRASTQAQGLGRLPENVLAQETQQLLNDLALMLAQRPFFYADVPSAADFSVYGQVSFGLSGTSPAFEAAFNQHQNLQQHYQRIKTLLA